MFSYEEILHVTGGEPLYHPGQNPSVLEGCVGVSTDTRSIRPGDLFIALVGERFDGHMFLCAAAEKGATIALLSRKEQLPDSMTGILVSDTLKALQCLARAYRRKLACRVIAVTGSVGKTSTREMLYFALSKAKRTHATKQNLNNEIGLPLTILSAPRDTEILILEMGMRMRGEIEVLSRIAEPDIALITNVGVSHIERLGSREEIRDAKLEICSGLRDDGVLLYSGNDEYLAPYFRKTRNNRPYRIGETLDEGSNDDAIADLAVRAVSVHCDHEGTSFSVEARINKSNPMLPMDRITIPAIGSHQVKNAMFAVLAALVLDVSLSFVVKGLTEYYPTGSRSKVIRVDPYLLIDDAYNASPESMAAAFTSLHIIAEKENRRAVAALGCVLELGAFAEDLHVTIGQAAAKAGIHSLYLCGDFAKNIADGARMIKPQMNIKLFSSREDLTSVLLQEIEPGDAILAKGSHAFAMEKVIEAILSSLKGKDKPEDQR